MRNSTRATAALFGAIVLTGVTAVSASAVEDTTTATVEVEGGILAIDPPADFAFAKTVPGLTTAEVTLEGIKVTDTRAGIEGWTASVHSSDFTSTTKTIPAANFSYTAQTATVEGTATVTATATAVAGNATDATIHTATAVTGNHTATWNAAVSLTIPADALAATDYTATLTHSVL